MTSRVRFDAALCTETVPLHVQSYGQGAPMVLAHGFGGSCRNFFPQIRALRASHQLWVYDARGHARSGTPRTAEAHAWPCLVGDFGRVVGSATRHSSSQTVLAGGLSLGAATALFWAIQNRTRTRGLVLAAYPDSTDEMRNWAAHFARSIECLGIDQAGQECVWGDHGRFQTSDAQLVRRGFLEHRPASLAAILRFSLGKIPDIAQLDSELRGLRVPTLVVVGANDAPSLRASHRLVELLPEARLAIISDAGHVANLSQPGDFNRHVVEFAQHCAQIRLPLTPNQA